MTGTDTVNTPVTDSVNVLVVGGGTAGTVAAADLARRGLRTRLGNEPGADASHDVILGGPARQARPSSLGGWDDSFTRPAEVLNPRFGAYPARHRRLQDGRVRSAPAGRFAAPRHR